MDVTPFEVGDIVQVRLNKTSPLMSVSVNTTEGVLCQWFQVGSNTLHEHAFRVNQLELVTARNPKEGE